LQPGLVTLNRDRFSIDQLKRLAAVQKRMQLTHRLSIQMKEGCRGTGRGSTCARRQLVADLAVGRMLRKAFIPK